MRSIRLPLALPPPSLLPRPPPHTPTPKKGRLCQNSLTPNKSGKWIRVPGKLLLWRLVGTSGGGRWGGWPPPSSTHSEAPEQVLGENTPQPFLLSNFLVCSLPSFKDSLSDQVSSSTHLTCLGDNSQLTSPREPPILRPVTKTCQG
jgi:hypothetical protein